MQHVTQLQTVKTFNNNKYEPKSLTMHDIFLLDDNWVTFFVFLQPHICRRQRSK